MFQLCRWKNRTYARLNDNLTITLQNRLWSCTKCCTFARKKANWSTQRVWIRRQTKLRVSGIKQSSDTWPAAQSTCLLRPQYVYEHNAVTQTEMAALSVLCTTPETRLLHRQFIQRTLYQESQTILYTSFRLSSIFLIRQKYVANFVSDLKKNHLKYHNTKLIQSGVTTTIIDILWRHRTFVIMADVNLCTQNSIRLT